MADDNALINQINNTDTGAPSPGPTGGAAPGAAAGAGAGNFLQGLTAGATTMANGAQQMLSSAQSGQLKFDPQTGQALVNTLNTHITDLNNASQDIATISQRTPLGTTAGGTAMAAFNQDVASTGGQAFAPVHQQFTDSLRAAVQAITIAMDNYAKTDADNASKLKPKD